MTDQPEPMDVSPVKSSLPLDHLEPSAGQRAQNHIDRADTFSRQNVVLKKIIRLLWSRIGVTTAKYGRFELDSTDEKGLMVLVDEVGNARLWIES
jgi:hypothetical protein